jgi:hypothetical protein
MRNDDLRWMRRCGQLLAPLSKAMQGGAWGVLKWRLRTYAVLSQAHLWLWRRGIEV